MEKNYKTIMQDSLNCKNAEYKEIRVEETVSTRINYNGKTRENVSINSHFGGSARSMSNGGWGFTSFNEIDLAPTKMKESIELANYSQNTAFKIQKNTPIKVVLPAEVKKDPRKISLSEKITLLDHYKELVLSDKRIHGCEIVYGDTERKVIFADSDGNEIEQNFIHVILRIAANSSDGNDMLQSGFSIGSLGDYSIVENLDNKVLECSKKSIDLIKAPKITGQETTVVLDQILAGVFVHEAFGHLSEADNVYENKRLQEILKLGEKFGNPDLNITDGAKIPNLRGSYEYDDEGTPSTSTPLIREGVLVGRLHSKETASKLDEKPTGNARAISYAYPPIVRMTNTIIENSTNTKDEIIKDTKDGLYVKNWYGGMTEHEMFTFSSAETYKIENGEIKETLRPVKLSGNLFTTLKNINGIANDLEINQGGGCGKGGQSPLPVSNGSPHIRINNCLVSSG
ncbi:MAG: peptidase C69 [Chloroflexi bacterium]|nr:peptidase C69 [Chloroflexota bacterium]